MKNITHRCLAIAIFLSVSISLPAKSQTPRHIEQLQAIETSLDTNHSDLLLINETLLKRDSSSYDERSVSEASFVSDIYQMMSASHSHFMSVLHMYYIGDAQYRVRAKGYVEMNRKRYIKTLEIALNNTIKVQANLKHPAVFSSSEKLKESLRRSKAIAESMTL